MKAWLGRLFGGADPVALRAARWVVVDCETSGLDAARDRLLAVGAVAVRGGHVVLGESYSAVLRQDLESDAANILVHGIGGDAQRNGRPAARVLDGKAGLYYALQRSAAELILSLYLIRRRLDVT